MSIGTQRRKRSDLFAALALPPGQMSRLLSHLRQGDVLARLGLCLLAATAMWAATGAWQPPFPYRIGDTPSRDVAANVAFSVVNEEETAKLRKQARAQALCVYENNRQLLIELRQALKDSVFRVITAESFVQMNPESREAWSQFYAGAAEKSQERFDAFREAFAADKDLTQFQKSLENAFVDFERHGLLMTLEHELEDGSHTAILVHDVGKEGLVQRVEVAEVRIPEAVGNLQKLLARELADAGQAEQRAAVVAPLIAHWLDVKKLPITLRIDHGDSERSRHEAQEKVALARREYAHGSLLAEGRKPLTNHEISLLRQEHAALVSRCSRWETLGHSLGDWGVLLALFVLCGSYLVHREQRLWADFRRFSTLLAVVVATVTLCAFDNKYEWRAAIIPLVLFSITLTIAYDREFAILTAASAVLLVTLTMGHGLGEFVVRTAAVSAAALLVGRIRHRTKLIHVGLGTGIITALAAVGVGELTGQTFGWSGVGQVPFNELDKWLHESFSMRLVMGAVWLGLCSLLAGVLMTGLLPFLERSFDVQTDLSLLELGDAAHPLLQQLVQRSPGTYNHSIIVATIAEAAAEAIGANGLLTRVGAYFHDIGKMLKPAYFIENQGSDGNRHESLLPAMSTLVIIAHVKDGADLARQYHLPQSIIDFVEQHHGTTLVEYFFNEAARRSEEDPHFPEVDETSYRYPGPKPQTRETAVLMLSDVAEGACRTLVDPTPARIQHLVHELILKRLLDGQFDECGLAFRELSGVEDSLVKSLTSVYHGRVKYPGQQIA